MAEPTLTATPGVTGGVAMELVGDSSSSGVYLRAGADSLQLPIPVFDEDFAESQDTEGGSRVRSRPQNAKLGVSVFVKQANSPAGMWGYWKTWEQLITAMNRFKGTIVYTPKDGTTPITYLVESCAITEAPQEEILLKQGYAPARAEFTCRPYGLLPPLTATLTDVDPFNRDSLTNQEWRFTTGAGQLAVNEALLATVTGTKILTRPLRAVDGTGYLKFTTTGVHGANKQTRIILKFLDGSNYLFAGWDGSSLGVSFAILKNDAGVVTTLQSTPLGSALAFNTDYWLKFNQAGNVLTLTIYSTDPNGSNPTAPIQTATHTLTAGNATKFGAGVKGSPGLYLATDDLAFRWDSWRFDTTVLEGFDPVLNFEILNIPGSVSALVKLTASDISINARDYLSIGLDDRYYDSASPQPTMIDSDQLVTTGLAGFQSSKSSAYNPKGSGNNTIRATGLSSTRQAVCSTGTQLHTGNRRISARVYGDGTGPIYVRLAYRFGDGQWSRQGMNWKLIPSTQPNNTLFPNDVDLGTIQIPEWATSWEGRIETYTASGLTTDAMDVDFIVVMPAGRYLKATKPTDISVSSLLIAERFNQSAGDLSGQTVGGGANQLSSKTGATFADGGGPGLATWTNPGNASAEDGNEASAGATLAANNFAANFLRMTMGANPFAIPAGGTIKGIEFKVKKRVLTNQSNSSGNEKAIDNALFLTKDGTNNVGSNKADSNTDWPLASTWVSYGGPNDLWGTTWTVAEVNSANFGVKFQPSTFVFQGGLGIANTFYVDKMIINVYYTDSAGNAWVVSNSAGTAGQLDVDTTGTQAQRTAVSDATLQAGRWSIAGGGSYADVGAAITVYKTDQALAAETFAGGLLLRYTDVNNCLFVYYYMDLSGVQTKQIQVAKRVGGVITTLGPVANFSGSLAGGRRLWAQVLSDGSYTVWSGAPGQTNPTLVATGADAALAAGGALASGKVGFYDAKTGATATTRNYDDLEIWIPDVIQPVIGSGGNFVVDHQSALRAGGSRPLVEGAYLKANPSGNEKRGAQFALKGRRTNVDYVPDTNIADLLSVGVQLTPRVALLNP